MPFELQKYTKAIILVLLSFGIKFNCHKESLPLHVLRGMTYCTDRPKALTLFLHTKVKIYISSYFVIAQCFHHRFEFCPSKEIIKPDFLFSPLHFPLAGVCVCVSIGRNRQVWNEMPFLALLPAEKSAQGSVHALGPRAERGSRLASQT